MLPGYAYIVNAWLLLVAESLEILTVLYVARLRVYRQRVAAAGGRVVGNVYRTLGVAVGRSAELAARPAGGRGYSAGRRYCGALRGW